MAVYEKLKGLDLPVMGNLLFAYKWTFCLSSFEAGFVLDFVHCFRVRPMLCGIPPSKLVHIGWGWVGVEIIFNFERFFLGY